jgi:hypothetical protein
LELRLSATDLPDVAFGDCKHAPVLGAAVGWLTAKLSKVPVPAVKLPKQFLKAGYSLNTLYRARVTVNAGRWLLDGEPQTKRSGSRSATSTRMKARARQPSLIEGG